MKFFIILLAVCLASCTSHSPNGMKGAQTLRINSCREPATLDPRKGGDFISSTIQFMLFEGLVKLNPDSSISPAAAESFEISEDGRTYTFHLRLSKWSDGTDVTAYDFERSWKDILDPAFPALNAHLLYPIKNAEAAKRGQVPMSEVGIVAKDERTLVVVLDMPTPYFCKLISFCVFFPAPQGFDANKQCVSNGPFKLKKWKHNCEILLEKNNLYWNADAVTLENLHISMIDNEMTALQLYENGELDIIGTPMSPLPVEAMVEFARQGILSTRPIAATTFCSFNTDRAPFSNVHLRKAFAFAINRKTIVENITQLGETAATCAIPPVMKGHDSFLFADADERQARVHLNKGLEELGMQVSDLDGIVYYYNHSELNHRIAQALQEQWKEVLGINVSLQNLEHKVLLDMLAKRNYTMAQTQWIAQYSDRMNILERFKSKDNAKNYPSWENASFAKLLTLSAYEMNAEKRIEILEQAEKVFMDEMPVSPLYHWNYTFLVKPYVKDFCICPIGGLHFDKVQIDP